MENFVVSARKYRPAIFDHVVGQVHVTTTLKNAIRHNKLAQAFLFCGPRGVGKTTCARILAKAVNCERITSDVEPCNVCGSCVSFNDTRSFNIHELDAASNNSVEDIRSLVEQVRYPPQKGHYKVYIIDEVHMLSHAAFNAFLKTLEEPPSYVLFILATTEKHKIIPTILSRCQIFDFKSIRHQDTVQQLKKVAQRERIAYEEEALYLMSQKAGGSLRDALSIFDLVAAFSSGNVTLQDTRQHLHILDHTHYFELTEACSQGNPGKALLLYDTILKAGFDGHQFVTGLSGHLRNLMLARDETALSLLETSESVKAQYQTQAADVGPTFLSKALHITNQCDLQYKQSHHKRLHVELALIALAHLQADPPLTRNTKVSASPHTGTPSSAPPKPVKHPSPDPITAQHQDAHEVIPQASSPNVHRPTSPHSTIRLPKIDQLKQSLRGPTITTTSSSSSSLSEVPKPLTERDVTQHWHAYAHKLKEEGRMTEHSLMNQGITLRDTHITVQLVNTVQQDTFAQIKKELTNYLRNTLQHPTLELRSQITQDAITKKPYTAQEKIQYLTEKYPHLKLLQERLALEVQA
jgi:DNA polymerase-3 subunit gamma/tau